MKMRLWLALVVVVVLHVDGSPGRKNKNKDGSIFDNNKNKNNLFSNKNTDFGSGTYKKKGGAMKTLKKAAVIGEDDFYFTSSQTGNVRQRIFQEIYITKKMKHFLNFL